MFFRTLQQPLPASDINDGDAVFDLVVPSGRRWLLVSFLRQDRLTGTGSQVLHRIVHNGEEIAAIERVRSAPKSWSQSGGTLNLSHTKHYPLRQLLNSGDRLTVTINFSFGGGIDNLYYLRLWDLDPGDPVPETREGPTTAPHAPTAPQLILITPEADEPKFEEPAPLVPDPPILESPLTPFEVDEEDFPGLARARAYATSLSEQLHIGQLPASARDIAVQIGRGLSHLVGADRFASRLIRATSGGALAVTRTHRSYISNTVKSPPFAGHDEVFRRPLNDATFQSLAGEWDVYTLNPEQYSAGVVITDVTPIRVQPGELVELRQEIKALHADEPLSGGFVGNGFRINGWI